jgi:hypothetical protein
MKFCTFKVFLLWVYFALLDPDPQHWRTPVPFYLQGVFYDRYEKEMVSQVCNSSLCTLVQFQFSLWPDHVRDLKLQAYRYHVCTGYQQLLPLHSGPVPVLTLARPCAGPQTPDLQAFNTVNSSLCTQVQFQFSLWSDHVRDLKLQAYRYLVCMPASAS